MQLPLAAKRAARKIINISQNLEKFPELGKPVAELTLYRDLSITFVSKVYVLRYRIYDGILYIMHLKHYQELNFKISD